MPHDRRERLRNIRWFDQLVAAKDDRPEIRADLFYICFAKRGNKSRTSALNAALESARRHYEHAFGYAPKARVEITPSTPKETVGGLFPLFIH